MNYVYVCHKFKVVNLKIHDAMFTMYHHGSVTDCAHCKDSDE